MSDNKKDKGGLKIILLVLFMLLLITVMLGLAMNQFYAESVDELGDSVQEMLNL